ncbi:MAG TPA: ABC transporter ATP-binding protein, partial [Vicinamibacterales bacterium]|nr:ABC transporter ATP-binding protein [Vicinamibacterales bacterium]
TLALALMGLLPPAAELRGSIQFQGRELTGLTDRDLQTVRGAELGIVFQESSLALNPLLRAGVQIAEVVRAHERCDRGAALERARAAMAEVGLGENLPRIFDAYPHELSGGERQRVLIAQAIVCRPRLVIADEPVASLDADVRADVLGLIRTLNEQLGISFLLITHSADVLATTATRVIKMTAGRIDDRPEVPTRTTTRVRRTSPRVEGGERGTGTGEPLVELRGLRRTYTHRRMFSGRRHEVEALRGVDMDIERGSTLGLTGRSGCGKSTLARCMAGLEPADAGHIRINGTDIAALRGRALLPYRNQLQVIFQDSAAALNPRFTAGQIVIEPLVIQGIGTAADRRHRAAELMALVELPSDRLESRPEEFSGGERQRLAIARALAVDPAVLIFDESFSGLDQATRSRILGVLMHLQAARGLTFVCISHDLALLAEFASEVALMREGRIVERGVPDEVLYRAYAGHRGDTLSPDLAPIGATA